MDRELKTSFQKWLDQMVGEGMVSAVLQVEAQRITFDPRSGIACKEAPPPQTVLTGKQVPPKVRPPSVPRKGGAVTEDQAAWESARRTDAVNSYRKYLKGFPRGAHVKEAQEAIRRLTGTVSPRQVSSYAGIAGRKKRFNWGLPAAFLLLIALGTGTYFIVTGSSVNRPRGEEKQKTPVEQTVSKESKTRGAGIPVGEEGTGDPPPEQIVPSDTADPAVTSVDHAVKDLPGKKTAPAVDNHSDTRPPPDRGKKEESPDSQLRNQEEPDASQKKSPAIEKTSPPKPQIGEVYFISIPSEYIRNYKREMSRLQIPGLKSRTSVSGEIRLNVFLDSAGKPLVRSFTHDRMKVTPASHREGVLENIKGKIHSLQLRPPVDKKGRPVRVKNFILSYRVGRMGDQIILNLLN